MELGLAGSLERSPSVTGFLYLGFETGLLSIPGTHDVPVGVFQNHGQEPDERFGSRILSL